VRQISIVIPAHNESRHLQSLLSSLDSASAPLRMEIVVVANGCDDDTADVARQFDGVTVVELDQASKVLALNAGDRIASTFPRIYLDGDIQISVQSLSLIAEALDQPGALVVSPQLDVDVSDCPLAVRLYYEAWERTGYRRGKMIGSGLYAMSALGRARFGEFPDLIADDGFVAQQFTPSEISSVQAARFIAHAPRSYSALLKRGARIWIGNEQLRRAGIGDTFGRRRLGSLVAGQLDFRTVAALAVYAASKLLMRALAKRRIRRRADAIWSQDRSTRD
jgi:glycosyltransferase involved in cell wall biosynthesis